MERQEGHFEDTVVMCESCLRLCVNVKCSFFSESRDIEGIKSLRNVNTKADVFAIILSLYD